MLKISSGNQTLKCIRLKSPLRDVIMRRRQHRCVTGNAEPWLPLNRKHSGLLLAGQNEWVVVAGNRKSRGVGGLRVSFVGWKRTLQMRRKCSNSQHSCAVLKLFQSTRTPAVENRYHRNDLCPQHASLLQSVHAIISQTRYLLLR